MTITINGKKYAGMSIDDYDVTRSGNKWIGRKDGKTIEAETLSDLIIKIDQAEEIQ